MKKTKTLLTMLILLLSAGLLFAQGAKEIAEDESLIKVQSVVKDEDHLDINGLNAYGQEVTYHVTDSTDSRFSVDSFGYGDYLAIKDTGIATNSIPAQLTATAIRRVTLAVNMGIVGNKIESEVKKPASNNNVALADINMEDMFERFNYSYGYLTMQNMLDQGIIPNASYFARGVIDAADFINAPETLYELEDMNGYIETFVNDYFSAGVITEAGDYLSTLDEIKELESSEDDVKRFSYAYGFLTTYELLYSGIDIRGEIYASGIMDAIYNAPSLFTEEEMEENVEAYASYLEETYNEYLEQFAEANLEEAESFLDDNKEKEGIVVLDSGVQLEFTYKDSTSEVSPKSDDTVVVDYTLRLLDGTVLDQGTAVEFPLTSLIPGFVDAVVNMHVGDSVTAYIHPELGYGESGSNAVEPNKLLIFDITLNSIKTE